MKKLALCFAVLGMVSCGGGEEGEGEEKKEMNYEDKVKKVCDCFSEAKEDPSKNPECFQMQNDYAMEAGDKKMDFIQETNDCAN